MVFTGIVQEQGTVLEATHSDNVKLWDGSFGKGLILKIKCAKVMTKPPCYIGASICVNGVCLTVTEFQLPTVARLGSSTDGWFKTNVGLHTINVTAFKTCEAGDVVNLEAAYEEGTGNSGHNVQGHVDGEAKLLERRLDGDVLWLTFENRDPRFSACVVPRGYVALNGVSLTIAKVDSWRKTFSVMLVAHTQSCVNLPMIKVGETVNVEGDSFGKYALSFMANSGGMTSSTLGLVNLGISVAALACGLLALQRTGGIPGLGKK